MLASWSPSVDRRALRGVRRNARRTPTAGFEGGGLRRRIGMRLAEVEKCRLARWRHEVLADEPHRNIERSSNCEQRKIFQPHNSSHDSREVSKAILRKVPTIRKTANDGEFLARFNAFVKVLNAFSDQEHGGHFRSLGSQHLRASGLLKDFIGDTPWHLHLWARVPPISCRVDIAPPFLTSTTPQEHSAAAVKVRSQARCCFAASGKGSTLTRRGRQRAAESQDSL